MVIALFVLLVAAADGGGNARGNANAVRYDAEPGNGAPARILVRNSSFYRSNTASISYILRSQCSIVSYLMYQRVDLIAPLTDRFIPRINFLG